MKTRRLLALLLMLPMLAFCQKPEQENEQEQKQEQNQNEGKEDPTPTPTDPYAEAAQEVKDGDVILVTNEKVQAFLEEVTYPERDYSETHILDEKYGPTAPGQSDKPQMYSVRWAQDESAGELTVKLW